jgi:hypothetical protein
MLQRRNKLLNKLRKSRDKKSLRPSSSKWRLQISQKRLPRILQTTSVLIVTSAEKIVKEINHLLKISTMKPQTQETGMLSIKLMIKCTLKIFMMKINLKRTGKRKSQQKVTMISLTWTTPRVSLMSS